MHFVPHGLPWLTITALGSAVQLHQLFRKVLTHAHSPPPKGSNMNQLQRYIELRGISCQTIADATRFGYHSIQKNVKGVRCNIKIREAIAKFLDIDASRAWGRGSLLYLRKLVAAEANRVADEKAKTAREEFLKKYSDGATLPAKRKAVNV